MYITCTLSTAYPKLIAYFIVRPDTSTVHGQLCWPNGLQNQEAAGMKRRLMDGLIDCVLPATKWSVWNAATRSLIGTYRFLTANKAVPPLRMFVSRNTVLRYAGLGCYNFASRTSLFIPSGFKNQQFCVLPTQCIGVFCVDLGANSDYFTIQH